MKLVHGLASFALGLFLVLLSCSSVDTNGSLHLPVASSYDFWVDPSVDAQNTTAIQVGVEEWTTYTDAAITLHYGTHLCIEDGCFNIIQVPQKTLDAVVGEDYIGWTTPYLITLTPAPTWDEAQDTAIHEEGHAIGLWHPCVARCSTYAVMNPTYGDGEDHVGCRDVAAYYQERGRSAPPTVTPCTDIVGALDTPDAGP